MTEKVVNRGEMPRTDFHYEEFEGYLASYYLTFLPLKEGSDEDKADFEAIVGILDGLAERQGVQKPEQAAANPQPTREQWGQPEVMKTCSSLVDSMRAFRSDFGVGMEPETVDMEERLRLGWLILKVLHRHGVIEPIFEEIDGVKTPVSVVDYDDAKFSQSLQEVINAV